MLFYALLLVYSFSHEWLSYTRRAVSKTILQQMMNNLGITTVYKNLS